MKCPACGYENRINTHPCLRCGAALGGSSGIAYKKTVRKSDTRPKNTIISARHGVVRLKKDILDFRRAGFFIRSCAMIIDLLFVVMLEGALLFGGAVLVQKTTNIVDMILTSNMLDFLFALLPLLKSAVIVMLSIVPLYFIAMTALFGQTIGKMITGVRIVRSDGRPVSLPWAMIRFLAYIPSGLLLFVGFLWILWDPERQGWHDMLADTVVIRL